MAQHDDPTIFDEVDDSRDPLDEIAEDYLARLRAGEHPSVEAYASLHPELAEGILDLLPTLGLIEQFAPIHAAGSGSSPPTSGNPDAPRAIEQLGEFRLLREIGRGGMGVVYEAEQTSLGRRVALKILPYKSLLDSTQLERFRLEARIAARLHHSNIVPVFNVGEHGGVCYYAMQYIHGHSLAEVLAEVRRLRLREAVPSDSPEHSASRHMILSAAGLASARSILAQNPVVTDPTETNPTDVRFPTATALVIVENGENAPEPSRPSGGALRTAVSSSTLSALSDSTDSAGAEETYARSVARIGLQVAEALAYAHQESILHRDIKPSNLLLDTRGNVWITDFGLAKREGSDDLTASGNFVGTLRYMAPERFEGEADPRSDVYGLGVTLYEVLTLRPAFESADRAQLVRDIATREPARPRRVVSGVPRDLETIILKAIQKRPEDRYESAAALALDLRRFLSYETVLARRASAIERVWRWCRRNRLVASLALTVALLLVALALGATIAAVKLAAENDEKSKNLERALEAEDASEERLVEARLEEAKAWTRTGEIGQRSRAIEALDEVARHPSRAVRDAMIAALARTDLVETAETSADFDYRSYDGRHELGAIIEEDSRVTVRELTGAGRIVLELPVDPRGVHHVVLSPAGSYLAVTRGKTNDRVHEIIRVNDGTVLRVEPHSGPMSVADFAPGERLWARAASLRDIVIADLVTGEEVCRISDAPSASLLRFDPTGRYLAIVGDEQQRSSAIHVHEIPSGERKALLVHGQSVVELRWHPAGDILAASIADYSVQLWTIEPLRRVQRLDGHFGEVTRLAFHPDGRHLLTSGWDGRTCVWDASTGRLLVRGFGTLSGIRTRDGITRFTRNHERGDYGYWSIEGSDVHQVLAAPQRYEKGPFEIATAPDGKWLAASSRAEGVRLWRLGAQDSGVTLRCPSRVQCVRFDPATSELLVSVGRSILRWSLRPAESADREQAETDSRSVVPTTFVESRGELPIACSRFEIDSDGRHLVAENGREVIVYRGLTEPVEIARFGHEFVDRLAIGPGASWVASSTWGGRNVRVWDPRSRALLLEIETGNAAIFYLPAQRWLAVHVATRVEFYDTTVWTLAGTIPCGQDGGSPAGVAASPDGRSIVFAPTRAQLAIVDVESMSEVARLESSTSAWDVTEVVWTPDGRRIVSGTKNGFVQIWDIAQLRTRLRASGLDWRPQDPISAISKLDSTTSHEIRRADHPRALLSASETWAGTFDDLDLASRTLELDISPRRWLERGKLLARRNLLYDALHDFDEALRRVSAGPSATARPDDESLRVRVLLERSDAYLRTGQHDRSIDDLAAAFALIPQDPERSLPYHRSLRKALATRCRERASRARDRGELDAARRDLGLAVRAEPENTETALLFAWLWLVSPEAQTSELALSAAERASADPSRGDAAKLTLAGVAAEAERIETARTALASLTNSAPGDDDFLRRSIAALIELRAGDVDGARQFLETIETSVVVPSDQENPLAREVARLRLRILEAVESELRDTR
jgi:WD40 repeat protein/tetratricopeptide (TPR) repeat protein